MYSDNLIVMDELLNVNIVFCILINIQGKCRSSHFCSTDFITSSISVYIFRFLKVDVSFRYFNNVNEID